jgi:RNA polymerase sigma factor (sigma-70 family)
MKREKREDILGFDAAKLGGDTRVLDPDAASLDRLIQNVAANVAAANAARGGHGVAGMLASTKPPPMLDSPVLRAFAGIPAPGSLEAGRPSGALVRGVSVFVDNPLLKTMAKLASLGVPEGQASAAFDASRVRGSAYCLRALRPAIEQPRSAQSIYNIALGRATAKPIAEKRSFAGQYSGNTFGFGQPFGTQSSAPVTQAAQALLRAYERPPEAVLDAFNPPLFDAIGKFALKYAGWARRVGELIESWGRSFEGALEWLRRETARWPLDPYGELVPVWNVRLYRLAVAAYGSDLVAQATFLNEIEADDFLDNVSLVDDLLKPTFDPERADLRKDWWLMEPTEARCWLRSRLRDLRIKKEREREAAERLYAQREITELLHVQGKRVIRATARDVLDFDPDLIEFERLERETSLRQQIRELLSEILSERQHQIFWHLAHGMTHEQIAHRLGISQSTVKVHAMRMRENVRANPELVEVLRLNGTLG